MVLGLDVSTSCVGYAFTKDKKIIDMGFIDLKKQKTPKEKTFFVLTHLSKSPYIDEVTKINIEALVVARRELYTEPLEVFIDSTFQSPPL